MKTDQETKWKIETVISLFSFLISIGALAFTIYFNLVPGTVQPFKPSGFTIIRGIDPFPSDHIVLPLEWQNSGGRSALIRHPRLILHEIDNNGKETGNNPIIFYLAGDYQDISATAFTVKYNTKSSFIIDPHTITQKTLVFHINNWWDDKGSTYSFRFVGGTKYKANIAYEINSDPETIIYLCNLYIYESTDNLNQDRDKGYWWDYWTLD
jgi:hypothetical protein